VASSIAFGNYELVERIAEGGMAEVWRARSIGVAGFEKTVVIKRVLPSLLQQPGFAELLVREAKIAARLNHPNIVQIFDLGEQDGSYFIAMEFLRGKDLAAALSYRAAGEPPLPLELRLWVAAEVARALDYAHRARFDDGKPMAIVHRDVSPQNVLLGYEGEVKVADFGIARADEPGLGRGEDPKILRGKYAYMSPEQARGEPLDSRSDLFSFGVLLYELVTKRRMFRGQSSEQTLEALRAGKLPEYQRHLPLPELEPMLRRALAPAKADRYESALEIHAALTKLVFGLGRPVGAPDLSAAMQRMFPDGEQGDPNKLRVDLMVRAYDDATAASTPGRLPAFEARTQSVDAQTRALPTSRRLQADRRRLVFLAVRSDEVEQALFDDAIGISSGERLEEAGGLRAAAFGLAGMERAVGHAVRAAIELRRIARLARRVRVGHEPTSCVFAGEGKVLEGAVVDAAPEVLERAAAMLARADPAQIRVDPALRPELGRDFVLREGDPLCVEGFRSRRDRVAGAMRQRAPLVGRRQTLRALSTILIDAADGEGALVHLVGAPGVGKSRLLAELRAAAAPKDFVFLQGRADEADHEGTFGALADLVMDLCGIEPEDAPSQRFEKVERLRVLGLAPREVRLLGELVGIAYPVSSDERPGRPRGVELALILRKTVRGLSQDRVVVLALEDLQWMDEATRQVLPLLVGASVPTRVVLLVTRRSGSTGPLPRGGRTLELEPLDRDATGRLFAHHLGVRALEPALAEHLLGVTGGIPAWIERVADSLADRLVIEDGVARRGRGALEIPLPDAVRSVVAARVERLREIERSMLRVAAALGGEVDVSLLAAVEGLIGNTGRAPLRRLWLTRLLLGVDVPAGPPERQGAWGGDEEDDRLPARIRLPSELLRRAVLADLDESESARLHARIVATLERVGAHETLEGLERLAEHAERSIDPRRAPDYRIRAAELALEIGDRPRASRHLEAAARVTRELTGDRADADAFELGLRAADAALDAGAAALARPALEALEDGEERAEPDARVRYAILRGRLARQELDAEGAIEALGRIEPLLDWVDPALRDRARTLLARTCVEHGATERGLTVLDAIIADAQGARLGTALALRAIALARLDRLEEAEQGVNDALALAARVAAPRLRFASLAALAVLEEARGDAALAAARFREAAEVAVDISDPDELARLHAKAAVSALAAGDLDEATARTDDAGRFAEQSTVESWRLVVDALRSALAILEHPDATWVPRLVRSVERLETLDRPIEAALAVEMLVHAHLALGDPGAAGRTLERAATHAERAGDPNYGRRLNARREALGPP